MFSKHLKQHKKLSAAITAVVILITILAGTFAWYTFNQNRINTFELLSSVPNINLHDDFAGGPEKDVYVENGGGVDVLVRVRLAELLNIGGSFLPDGAEDTNEATGWHIHTPSADGCDTCDFDAHKYFSWVMDGQKFYMPAHQSAKGGYESDVYIEPLAVGDTGTVIDYAARLKDAFTELYADDTARLETILAYISEYLGGNAANADALQTEIASIPDSYTVGDVRQYAGQDEEETTRLLNEVRLTLIPTTIITMQDWIGGTAYHEPYEKGNFWVIDSDGWCYWANVLGPNQATGQLLSAVNYENNYPGEDLTYKINVHLNATTFEDMQLNTFFIAANQNGGITESAKLFMRILTDQVLLTDDGAIYEDNGDGSFVLTTDQDGNAVEEPKAFIPLGEDASKGDIAAKLNTSADKRFYVGDKFDMNELVWDGDDYVNYDTEHAKGEPYYNIAVKENGRYELNGSAVGADGNVYLVVEDSDGNSYYLSSVQRAAQAEAGTFSLPEDGEDDSDEINSKWPEAYVRAYPGTGPFGVIIQGDSLVGTDRDAPPLAEFKARYFYHIGCGVYVEVDSPQDTQSKDSPVTYYFAGADLGEYHTINNVSGETIESQIENDFPLDLTVDEYFSVVTDDSGNVLSIENGGNMYIMQELVAGDGGKLFIALGNDGYVNAYIKPDSEGVLGGNLESGDVTLTTTTDGVINLPTPSGDGKEDDPYIIRNRYDMGWLSKNVTSTNNFSNNKFYAVANDFDMGPAEFVPIGTSAANRGFRGTFDGGGYTISGLTVAGTGGYRGLFGYVDTSGTVSSMTLEGVNVSGANHIGGAVGYNLGTIAGVTVRGKVSGTAANVGGVAGYNEGTVQGCLSEAEVTGTSGNIGGVVGNSSGTVQACINEGVVNGSSGSIGGVIGYNTGTVKACSNDGTVDATGNNVGGIAGNNIKIIEDCVNNGELVKGTGNVVGGIVGQNNGNSAEIKLSYSTGDVESTGHTAGGVAGYNVSGAKINDCYAWGNVTGAYNVGGVVGSVAGGTVSTLYHAIGNVTIDGAVSNDKAIGNGSGTYAVSRTQAEQCASIEDWRSTFGNGGNGFANAEIWGWDKTGNLPVFTFPLEGSGTQADPYLISSKEDLLELSALVNGGNSFLNKYLSLTGNIDMGSGTFTKIGSTSNKFAGTFDGGGNTISNLTINSTTDNTGLFGTIGSGGAVKNLTIDNADITSTAKPTGGVTGINEGTISGVTFKGKVTGKAQTGGIAGQNKGVIADCAVTGGSVAGAGNTGGVTGNNQAAGSILRSYNKSAVTGNTFIGGIAGRNLGVIKQSFHENTEAAITATGYNVNQQITGVGGVAGYNLGSGIIENCYAWGGVKSSNANAAATGGIAGKNQGSIVSSYHARGTVETNGINVGGAVGFHDKGAKSNVMFVAAMADTVKGKDNGGAGKFFGAYTAGALYSNCYNWDSMALTGTGGNAANGQLVWPDAQWTFGDFAIEKAVWKAETIDGKLYHVLVGVTP